jgi:hypothetical protein
MTDSTDHTAYNAKDFGASASSWWQGKNYIEMVQLIVRVLGTPSAEQLYFVSDKAREFIRNLPPQQGTGFAKLYPRARAHARARALTRSRGMIAASASSAVRAHRCVRSTPRCTVAPLSVG